MTRLFPRFAVAAVFATLFAGSASAGTAVSGLNLAWTDCGTFGTSDKVNTCASNGGAPQTMVASFIASAVRDSFLGCAGVLDITSSLGTMPSWWDLGAGGCRTGKVSVSFDFTASTFNCADFWQGQAAGGMQYDYPIDPTTSVATAPAVNHARIRTIQAVPSTGIGPIDTVTEYYAFKITISNALTTGAGSCAGCSTPMCIVFNSLSLSEPAPVVDEILSTPIAAGSNQITFQGGAGASCSAVPTKNKTWGQIKSLYR
jgi:hypothetical protein